MQLARSFKETIFTDAQNRALVDIVDANGATVQSNVWLRLRSDNVQQLGDKWGAQAANLVAQLDDNGTSTLHIDEGVRGADRGSILHFGNGGVITPLTSLEHRRIYVDGDGHGFIGNSNNLPTPFSSVIRAIPPIATDDISKGYKPGDLWVIGPDIFDNLLEAGFMDSSNWSNVLGTLAVSSSNYTAQITGRKDADGNSVALGTLSASIWRLFAGHKIYFQTRILPGFSSISYEILDGTESIFKTNSSSVFGARMTGIFTPGRQINNAALKMQATNTTSATAVVILEQAMVIDLTATQGQGNEFTLEQAQAFFSQPPTWQPAYGAVTPAAYICLKNSIGAANWKKITLT